MPVLTIRLDADDARRAKALREAGVQLSTLVRDVIRAEFERRLAGSAGGGGGRPSELLAKILAALPDPDKLPARRVRAGSREAVRRHAQAKLKRKR